MDPVSFVAVHVSEIVRIARTHPESTDGLWNAIKLEANKINDILESRPLVSSNDFGNNYDNNYDECCPIKTDDEYCDEAALNDNNDVADENLLVCDDDECQICDDECQICDDECQTSEKTSQQPEKVVAYDERGNRHEITLTDEKRREIETTESIIKKIFERVKEIGEQATSRRKDDADKIRNETSPEQVVESVADDRVVDDAVEKDDDVETPWKPDTIFKLTRVHDDGTPLPNSFLDDFVKITKHRVDKIKLSTPQRWYAYDPRPHPYKRRYEIIDKQADGTPDLVADKERRYKVIGHETAPEPTRITLYPVYDPKPVPKPCYLHSLDRGCTSMTVSNSSALPKETSDGQADGTPDLSLDKESRYKVLGHETAPKSCLCPRARGKICQECRCFGLAGMYDG